MNHGLYECIECFTVAVVDNCDGIDFGDFSLFWHCAITLLVVFSVSFSLIFKLIIFNHSFLEILSDVINNARNYADFTQFSALTTPEFFKPRIYDPIKIMHNSFAETAYFRHFCGELCSFAVSVSGAATPKL